MENIPQRELIEAQIHIWNHQFSFIKFFSLKCAIELGIFDIIHKNGKPMTVSDLIDALNINTAKANCLPRLMSILVHSGFLIIEKSQEGLVNNYMLTLPSRLLVEDEPLSLRPFLQIMYFDPLMIEPWHVLSEWFQNDRPTPVGMVNGSTCLYDYAGREPRLSRLFNEGMASDARFVNRLLIREFAQVFQGTTSLVDVAGGTGTLAKAIAEAYPNIECIVLDLPHVVHGLHATHNNLKFVGGDMFKHIPSADTILLKWIIHNWSDEESVEILKKCKEALPSKDKGGKLIIIDTVVGNQQEDLKTSETQLLFDMVLMCYHTGKERTEKEWMKLFFDAGFSDYKIICNLGVRSLIEIYP